MNQPETQRLDHEIKEPLMELLESAKGGNEQAERELLVKLTPFIQQSCVALLPPEVDSKEAVIETLVKTGLGLRGYTNEPDFELWVLRKVTQACNSFWKQTKQNGKISHMHLLADLTETERNILLLTDRFKLRPDEISKVLNQKDLLIINQLISARKKAGTAFFDDADQTTFVNESIDAATQGITKAVGEAEIRGKQIRRQLFIAMGLWIFIGLVMVGLFAQLLSSIQPATATTATGAFSTPVATPLFRDQADLRSYTPEISGDGRFIVFTSDAANLTDNDRNEAPDIFLVDRREKTISRVSLNEMGVEGNAASLGAQISDNGRWVAFISFADNLVDGDEKACRTAAGTSRSCADVFLLDRRNGKIELISKFPPEIKETDFGLTLSGGIPQAVLAISGDGQTVVFGAKVDNEYVNLYRYRRGERNLTRLDTTSGDHKLDGDSLWPRVNGNGRMVVFHSFAQNLASGDKNRAADIFLFSDEKPDIIRVTQGLMENGPLGHSIQPAISSDGIVYRSGAIDLTADDINQNDDLFFTHLNTKTTSLLTKNNAGEAANDTSSNPAISKDGRYVVFASQATNLDERDNNGTWDIYLLDRQSGLLALVSYGADGQPANGASQFPQISMDGRIIVFVSAATNLTGNDLNGVDDIYVYDRVEGTLQRVNNPQTP